MKRTWIPIVVLLLVSAVVAFNLLREPKEDAHAEGIKPKPFALTNKAQPKKHLSSVHASKSEVENAGRLLENRLDEEAFQDMEMPLSEIEIRKKEWFDQEKKVRDEAYEALALSHQSEPRDNRWASEAESELDTILSKLTESQNGISIIGSNCRSTMCRVDLAFEDPELRNRIVSSLSSPYFPNGSVRMYMENGEYRSVSYLSR